MRPTPPVVAHDQAQPGALLEADDHAHCAMNTPPKSVMRSSPRNSTPSRVAAISFRSRAVTKEIARAERAAKMRGEGEVVDLPPLSSGNEDESSGGETRTLNLAVNSRLLCH